MLFRLQILFIEQLFYSLISFVNFPIFRMNYLIQFFNETLAFYRSIRFILHEKSIYILKNSKRHSNYFNNETVK